MRRTRLAGAAGNGWIEAADPLAPARPGPAADDPWWGRPERARRARLPLVPRWASWGAILGLLGLIFRKAIA